MVNSWISHVKKYAVENNVPYKVAMKQAKASYNKMSGGMMINDRFEARPAVMPRDYGRPMRGGMSLKQFGLEQYDKVPDAYKPGIESLAEAVYHTGFGVKRRGRPRKMTGGMSLKDFGLQQYDKVPDAYKPGIESLAEAVYNTGFGLKKKRGRPRKMKGGDIFSDMKNAFDPNRNGVADAFRPGGPAEQLGKQVASELIHQGIPATTEAIASAIALAAQPGNPVAPVLAGYAGKKGGEYLANYVGDQTGYGVMSNALAFAKRKGKHLAQKATAHLQKLAKQKTNE